MQKVFDSHFHIIDPKFPLIPNRGFLPEYFPFDEYAKRAKTLNIVGGAVVSASYQGYDQSYLREALKQLGAGFVGVVQLPYETTDEEIIELAEAGVRALRFNIFNGLSLSHDQLASMAKRVYELARWHVELHVASSDLEELSPIIERLPAVSIDHLGLVEEGFPGLLRLVSQGVKVKASGFGRVDFDVKKALQRIYTENPEALLFGTDLPSTRAKRPFAAEDIELIAEALGETGTKKVLYSNAHKWYMEKN
ncbi:amidohydrolase family protein [Brevibacillus brevis]|uniref:Amidohydrolase family protein n=1 Tax=Brevibacillus brevis TaxID=1393 RepID=A0ABY9T1I0_BREBE|nr:amidohydrolase family protein [Brevibacillus brevis]WNC13714.1 amidohydrolase family protein [Brevibacillus brevis]